MDGVWRGMISAAWGQLPLMWEPSTVSPDPTVSLLERYLVWRRVSTAPRLMAPFPRNTVAGRQGKQY